MIRNNVSLVFFREVRDQLRDRRTLFMVAVLPLLLYPLLSLLMLKMMTSLDEQQRTVLLVNAQELPPVPLLTPEGDQFLPDYYPFAEDANKLQVYSDTYLLTSAEEKDQQLKGFLVEVQQRMSTIHRLGEIEGQLNELELTILNSEPGSASQVQARGQQDRLNTELQGLQAQLGDWFGSAPCDVLIVLPKGFAAEMQAPIQAGANAAGGVPMQHPVVLHNSANDKSKIAYERVRDALRGWERVVLAQRLQQAGLPISLPYPVDPRNVDLAKPNEMAANIWSKIFPTLLVIMAVTGAFYPAIDLGAGEKERGTMETLLISPATRTEIVLGKFFTVMLFSMSTAMLNLLSMGFTGKYLFSAVSRSASSPLGNLVFPPLSSLMWVVVLAIPISALFSALSLAFAMFARSSKEGQYYLTPMLMITMMLTLACLSPVVELTPYYSVLPVVGPTLLLKTLLLEVGQSHALLSYGLTVLLSSVVYSLLALWWAVDLFQREDILFREAEKVDLGLWLKHLLREKEPTPSFSEAAVCFIVIALVQFGFLTAMQWAVGTEPLQQLKFQTVFLVSTVGLPPVMMAILFTTNMRKTLKLQWPGWTMLCAGIVLPFALEPIALELMSRLDWFFPPVPAAAQKLLQAMSMDTIPLWLALTAFAIAPAICEELAFRGFIFTGLQRSRHKWFPVVGSALLFGVIHLIDKQIFNAALLGLVIGLLALRSGSLLPGILFHLIFNGLQVVAARIPAESYQTPLGRWLFQYEVVDGVANLRCTVPTLAICGLVSALIIGWLISTGNRGEAGTGPSKDQDNRPVHPFAESSPARI